MNIGIDAYPLVREKKAGISCYTYNILKNMLEVDNENEYFLYNNLGEAIDSPYLNVHSPIILGGSLINRFSTSWLLFNASRQLVKDKIDIFWGTQGVMPLNLPNSVKAIITIHDLTYYLYPHTMALNNYIVNKLLLRRSVINAHKIIAISHSTANDLKDIFKKENIGTKTSVVYDGILEVKQFDKRTAQEYLLHKFNISKEFILYVGAIEPRKNIPGLLEAFKIAKVKYNIPHQLILAGGSRWKTDRTNKIYKKLRFKKDDVIFLGYVEEKDLMELYSGADLFGFLSFYEGFGLPPLEAMACGVPVIASDIPVFREVLDKAALLVDLQNPQEIAGGIYNILTNKRLKEQLIQEGFKRAKVFSWEDSAERMVKTLNSMR